MAGCSSTDLPDGTELVLVPAGEQQPWDLTPQEVAELKERLAQADDSIPADEVHARLRPAAERLARAGGTAPRARAAKRSAWKP